MTTITIPTNSAELAEFLADDDKRSKVFVDAEAAKTFLASYAKATDRSGDISAQVSEQVSATLVDFFREQGQTTSRPDFTPTALATEIPVRGAGAIKNAARNPKAAGVAADKLAFAGVGDFLQTVHYLNVQNGRHNGEKLAKLKDITNAYSSQQGDLGGFLVPEDFRSEIMQVALEQAVVRPRATVITMSSSTTSLPMVDQTTHVGSVFGGMTFWWTPEAGELTESTAKFGRVKLEANKLTGYAVVPNELYNDATALSSWFNTAAPSGLAFTEDVAFLRGSGGNEPLGVFESGAMVTVNKETNQPADTIVWENIVKMFAAMLPTSIGSAVWIVNQTALPQLLSLSIAVGTGGAPVVTTNASNPALPLSILGRPVIVTEKASAIGDLNDIVFADLGFYLIGDRQTMAIESSTHVKFSSDQTAIRLIQRADGRPWIQSAITPLNGTAVSPFVNLQAR
ncbi:MAG: phage major capsid protein [Microbacteriaceae bacterium]